MIIEYEELDKCPICLNPILSNFHANESSAYVYDEDSMRCHEVIRLPCHHQICDNCYHQLMIRTSHPRCPLCNTEIPSDPYVYTIFISSSRLIGLRSDNLSDPVNNNVELTPYQRRILNCSLCFVTMVVSGFIMYKLAVII